MTWPRCRYSSSFATCGTLAKQPGGYITGGRIRCLRIGCESRSKCSRRGKRWTYAPDDLSVSPPLPGSAQYKQFVSDLGPAFDRRFVAGQCLLLPGGNAAQISVCSAISSASSTSMPRYRTVLSSLL